MTKQSHEHAENELRQDDAVKPSRFGIGLLIGLLAGSIFGGLAGAGIMLLLAPQSGKRTRTKLQQQSMILRNQATESIEDALADAVIRPTNTPTTSKKRLEKWSVAVGKSLMNNKTNWRQPSRLGRTRFKVAGAKLVVTLLFWLCLG